MNIHFFKDIHMAKRYIKRCSTSIIREILIRNTLRYGFIPVKMVIIEKPRSNKCWWGCGKKGGLLHCWWECKLGQPLWKTIRRFLKGLKLPCDSAIPLLGIYLKKMKMLSWKCISTFMFYCSIIYNSQHIETTYASIVGWMDKDNVVCVCMRMCVHTHVLYTHTHTHNGILFSYKKD